MSLLGVDASSHQVSGGGGGWTLVGHSSAASNTNTTGNTSAINTTGANLLVVVMAFYNGSAFPTLSDSYSNYWTTIQFMNSGAFVGSALLVASSASGSYSPPTVGTGHTFVASAGTSYPSICLSAFSGATTTNPTDQSAQSFNGGAASSVTIPSTGTTTPSQNNELIIAGFGAGATSGSSTVNESFTITDQVLDLGGNFGCGSAYLIQTTAAGVNPTFTGLGTQYYGGVICTFK